MCTRLPCKSTLLATLGLSLLAAGISPALDAEQFDARKLTEQVRATAVRVRPSVVGLKHKGKATAVVISPEGLVATAGHALMNVKEGDKFTLTFPDGTEASAEPLGYNLEDDLALLRITTEREGPWPFTAPAKTGLELGDFCFTLAHPAGRKKGRPAQLRIGRITMVQERDGGPWLLASDTEIQPGDSGGPLFSCDGKLVGIDSSAAGNPLFNRFATVERLHEDMPRLVAGERWGDFEKGPGGKKAMLIDVKKETVAKLLGEFQKRANTGHRPTLRYIRKKAGGSGELELDGKKLIHFMMPEVFALHYGVGYSMGLADPALIRKLPPLPAGAPAPLPLYADEKPAAFAVRVHEDYLLAKNSELPEDAKLFLRIGEKNFPVSRMAESEKHDVALLSMPTKLPEDVEIPIADLSQPKHTVRAGDGLIAVDGLGLTAWGVACDQARKLPKKITVGPLKNSDELISKRRAPFPSVVTHSLRLYAADAGTPIYDLDGRFVGIHHGRLCRTLGLMLPVEVLREIIPRLVEDARDSPDA